MSRIERIKLQDEVFRLIQTRASRLSTSDLRRLLDILKNDFQMDVQENSAFPNADQRAKEILSIDEHQLPHPKLLTSGWSSDAKLLPQINYADIFAYFIEQPSEAFNVVTMPGYKSMDAFKAVECGDVGQLETYADLPNEWRLVKGVVCSSQTAKELRYPWILVHADNGVIRGGQCSCKAGLGETCSHIGAILFYLEKATRCGINRTMAPTEVLCEWNQPAFEAETLPCRLSQFSASKRVTYERTEMDSSKIIPKEKLRSTGLLLQEISSSCRLSSMISTGADGASVFTDMMYPWQMPIDHVEEAENHPPIPTVDELVRLQFPANQKRKELYKTLFRRITEAVDDNMSETIEHATRGQSSSVLWKLIRKGRVTASMAHAVFTYYNPRGGAKRRLEPKSTMSAILDDQDHLGCMPAVKWGMKNEGGARKAFFDFMRPDHSNMRVEEMGLKVPPQRGHMGASVDGLVFCGCQACDPCTVLEIKCPFGVQNEDPKLPSIAKKLPYLDVSEDGVVSLKNTSRYYCQIQMQMGCWNLQAAHLFIWTTKGHLLLTVSFDDDYWKRLIKRIDTFYLNFIVPRLLS